MAIAFSGVNTDVFGGPAGSNQQALMQMVMGYMQAQEKKKKREEEAMIAAIMGNQGEPIHNDPNIAMNTPAVPDYGERNPYQARMQQLMSNPNIPIERKLAEAKMLDVQRSFEPQAKDEKKYIVKYTDGQGKPQERLVPESQYNQFVEYINGSGGTVGDVKEKDAPKSPIGKLISDRDKYEPGTDNFKAVQKEIDNRLNKEGSDSEFQKKAAALMDAIPGLTKDHALKITTGAMKVQKDPVTGSITLVDLVTQTARELSSADMPTPEPSPDEGRKTIWELSDLSTGPVSSAKAALSLPSGMVGGPVASETLQARQYVVNAQNDLVRALSINPRFPVGEINRIRDEINIAPKMLDNPSMLKNRIVAIDEYLKNRLENEQRASGDSNLPADQRQAARQAARDIENFLKILGAPPKVNSEAAYGKIRPGERYIDDQGNVRVKRGSR